MLIWASCGDKIEMLYSHDSGIKQKFPILPSEINPQGKYLSISWKLTSGEQKRILCVLKGAQVLLLYWKSSCYTGRLCWLLDHGIFFNKWCRDGNCKADLLQHVLIFHPSICMCFFRRWGFACYWLFLLLFFALFLLQVLKTGFMLCFVSMI